MRLGKVSSGFVFSSYRCVDRGCPTSPQARRSLAPCACRTCATAALLSCGLTIFLNQILQHRDVQGLIGHDTLQLAVLFFELLQPFRFAYFQSAVLTAPSVKRRCADPMLPA